MSRIKEELRLILIEYYVDGDIELAVKRILEKIFREPPKD